MSPRGVYDRSKFKKESKAIMSEIVEVHAIEGDEAPNPPTIINAPPPLAISDELDAVAPPTAPQPLHALDTAPPNSKVVVVLLDSTRKAVLATPDGVEPLSPDDPASKLPEGAVIQKVAEGKFISIQLNPSVDYPPLGTETAGEAIAAFVPYFHRVTVS